MAERGVSVYHAIVHRCAIHMLPVIDAVFRRRKRAVAKRWHMDGDVYPGGWPVEVLLPVVDRDSETIGFLLLAKRGCAAAQVFWNVPSTCTVCLRRSPST
jgi:transposase-like protein